MDFISREEFAALAIDQNDEIISWSVLEVGQIFKIEKINKHAQAKFGIAYLLDAADKGDCKIRVWAPSRMIDQIVENGGVELDVYFCSLGVEKAGGHNKNVFDLTFKQKKQPSSVFYEDNKRIPFPAKEQI